MIATWNGAGFDVPFLAHRFRQLGVETGMVSAPTDLVRPKYQALPGSGGCHEMHWRGAGVHPHSHFDVAYASVELASAAGVKHSLKPVARAAGIEMVEVDRSRIDLLTPAEQDAYVASDAVGTRELALRWFAGDLNLST